MVIAALIISVIALLTSTACLVILLAQKLSTHQIEILDSEVLQKQMQELNKQDEKINKKVAEIEADDEWI